MANMLQTVQLLIQCGAGLVLAFLVLLALPQSQLRSFLMPIVGWGVAIFCGIYCISPVDVVPEVVLGPFGLIDDAVALATGFVAARAAYQAREE